MAVTNESVHERGVAGVARVSEVQSSELGGCEEARGMRSVRPNVRRKGQAVAFRVGNDRQRLLSSRPIFAQTMTAAATQRDRRPTHVLQWAAAARLTTGVFRVLAGVLELLGGWLCALNDVLPI